MKKNLIYIGISSLFLLGCNPKVYDIDYSTILNKKEAKESFIVVISSDSCGYCQNLKKTYKKSQYNIPYYELDFVDMIKGINEGEKESIDAYKYYATLAEYAYSNIKSYSLNITYENYFKIYSEKYTYVDKLGKDKYLEGYVNLATPLSFFYIEGKLSNFEYGDYSSSFDVVMSRYEKEIKKGDTNNIISSSSNNISDDTSINISTNTSINNIVSSSTSTNGSYFNPYEYIYDITFNDLEKKIENKEDFIFVLSSKACKWCKDQFDDMYDNLHLKPTDFYFYYVDDMFVDLETNLDNEPLNGVEAYEQAKKEYRFFASYIEKIGDYILGEEGAYVKENPTERFGEIEPSLLYPTTLIFIDGEVAIELSYLGYGWTKTPETFTTFINMFNNLKDL